MFIINDLLAKTLSKVVKGILGTIRAYRVYKDAAIIKSSKFGKARFSESKEITDAGPQGAGVVFGKIDKTLITKPPTVEGHTLVVGGTGTGKSRGVVIPTLFKWEGSAIVMTLYSYVIP